MMLNWCIHIHVYTCNSYTMGMNTLPDLYALAEGSLSSA